jgi:hypothetical protein
MGVVVRVRIRFGIGFGVGLPTVYNTATVPTPDAAANFETSFSRQSGVMRLAVRPSTTIERRAGRVAAPGKAPTAKDAKRSAMMTE